MAKVRTPAKLVRNPSILHATASNPTPKGMGALAAMTNTPKLLDQVRDRLRLNHYSKRTESAYIQWIIDFLKFHRNKSGNWIHPAQLGDLEINQYLTYLAKDRNVAASTQNQALSALLFLYNKILDIEIHFDALRAKRPIKIPVVLSVQEVDALITQTKDPTYQLMTGLLYGSGIRSIECCRLRYKDVDLDRLQLTVHSGKGDKDRAVPIPNTLVDSLKCQMRFVQLQHAQDLNAGAGFVKLPNAFEEKNSHAATDLAWQYLFPSHKLTRDDRPQLREGKLVDVKNQVRRHHLHESGL